MSPFRAFAEYYDLLYRDKDYAAEALYVQTLIERYRPGTSTVLDLGCGTGLHALELAGLGYVVHGVDRSAEMLALAERHRAARPVAQQQRLGFSYGDVRSLRLDRSFDAVVALFHVMSYQTADDDLADALATARAHLDPGGLFVFDFWHGPAVLKHGPVARTKLVEDERVWVSRAAEPVWDEAKALVNVHYHLTARAKDTGACMQATEIHRMRYLFPNDLARLLADTRFATLACGGWMTDHAPPTPADWSAYVLARAI
jgi:SAM-dependent methyltransferase